MKNNLQKIYYRKLNYNNHYNNIMNYYKNLMN